MQVSPEGKWLTHPDGSAELDPVVVRAIKSSSDNLRLKDAKRMCNTLVVDVDGQWLVERLQRLRIGPAVSRANVVESDRPRVFHFRSSNVEHNLGGPDERAHYRTFDMPVGFRVSKVTGGGYSSWLLRIDNELPGDRWEYILIRYNQDKVPVIADGFRARDRRHSGPAGTRSRGRGPHQSD